MWCVHSPETQIIYGWLKWQSLYTVNAINCSTHYTRVITWQFVQRKSNSIIICVLDCCQVKMDRWNFQSDLWKGHKFPLHTNSNFSSQPVMQFFCYYYIAKVSTDPCWMCSMHPRQCSAGGRLWQSYWPSRGVCWWHWKLWHCVQWSLGCLGSQSGLYTTGILQWRLAYKIFYS